MFGSSVYYMCACVMCVRACAVCVCRVLCACAKVRVMADSDHDMGDVSCG